MKEQKRSKNGITLIALVITIIVLLILAGVTIVTLTGDNGLLQKTTDAKAESIKAEGLEKLKLAVIASYDNNQNINIQDLTKNLSKIEGLKYINAENEEINVEENTNIKLTAKFKLNGYNYKISDVGNVSYKKDGAIDNEDIINSPETYYGHYVTNYNSPYDAGITEVQGQLGKWQIFMADDTNIYLISSNYITRQYTGTKNNVGFDYDTTNQTPVTATYMWFTSIKDQYNANSTKTDIPEILSKLDKQNIYHKWMNNPQNQKKNYNNEKAVASMLDIDVWSGYKNTTYAKYAIGGPTLEMFCKAYNDSRVEGTDLLEAKDINLNNTGGYQIKKGNADPDYSVSGLKTGARNTLVDNMYFGLYWLASPAKHSNLDNGVHYIHSRGNITGTTYSNRNILLRPLVCLNSNVHLVQNTDGETYSLELD